uniref:GST C-terminal domain-containing protein n=1 Tax=Arion vulgaris TaxID=1028688 RepID=A0A0B6ZVK6_9EUPU
MSANEGGGNSESEMLTFELYIKASAIDKETKGSCPICQQFFMMTCLLGENQDNIDFRVFTVQADCPPKNFASGWSKKYPVIMVNSGKSKLGETLDGSVYDTFEELELFFESINRECPELKRKNAPNIAAMKVVENLYKHFNHFISGQSEKGLVGELKKLNEYLESQDTKFLVDNVLSFSDCHLLPRLQHIRVAGKAYRGFEIPTEFVYIWRYLKNAYLQEAFKSTMPSDQDIVFHYEKKAVGPPRKGSRSAKPTLEKFTYTTDVPEGIVNGIDNTDSQQVEES